jgi:hypothetical protein
MEASQVVQPEQPAQPLGVLFVAVHVVEVGDHLVHQRLAARTANGNAPLGSTGLVRHQMAYVRPGRVP